MLGITELIPSFLILGVAGVTTAFSLFFVKSPFLLAFLLPSFFAAGLFLSILFTGGIPYIFMALATLCGLNGYHLNRKYYLGFFLLLNSILLVFIVVLRSYKPYGWEY